MGRCKFWIESRSCRRQNQDAPFHFAMKGEVTNVCLVFQNEWLMVMHANDMSLFSCKLTLLTPGGRWCRLLTRSPPSEKKTTVTMAHNNDWVRICRLPSGCSCHDLCFLIARKNNLPLTVYYVPTYKQISSVNLY